MDMPEYLPNGEPDRVTTDEVFEVRLVPGISFFKDNDGIIYYYDQPLCFVAWIDNVQCFITLIDQGYEGPPDVAKGWDQYIAIAVLPDFLLNVYNSKHPFRAAYETNATTLFIHNAWNHYKEDGESAWNQEYKIWNNIPVQDRWKPDKGVFLDPGKPKEV